MLDTLNRRVRFAPPQPLAKRIEINDSDIETFRAINRHGPLPSHYLFAFTDKKSLPRFQDRLTTLYNGGEQGGYLIRRPEYFNSFFARYQHIVYDLNDNAKELLQEPLIHRTDPLIHRLMGACVGASIELACKERGLRYIPRTEVLQGKEMRLPLSFGEKAYLEPDDVFGIQYEDGSYRRFAVEIDRSTEPHTSRTKRETSLDKKFSAYFNIMQRRAYKEVWGIPNLMVLFVCTNAVRVETLKEMLKDHPLGPRFTFKVYPDFGRQWRVPKTLLPNILQTESVRGPFDLGG